MSNGTTTTPLPTQNLQNSPATDQGGGDDVVELHWMQEPDITMGAAGLEVPALCGKWMGADVALAEQVTSSGGRIRYVSCVECDVLHALDDLG